MWGSSRRLQVSYVIPRPCVVCHIYSCPNSGAIKFGPFIKILVNFCKLCYSVHKFNAEFNTLKESEFTTTGGETSHEWLVVPINPEPGVTIHIILPIN